MRLLVGFLVATALMLAAPVARADAPDAWQRKALTLAQRVWHPDCGTLRIEWANASDFGGDAEWGGWAYVGECTIYEPAAHYWLGYPEFCTDVLHEGGHAAGYGHSSKGIMRAERIVGYSRNRINGRLARPHWTGVDRRCLPSQSRHPRPRSRRARRTRSRAQAS